MKIKNGYRHKPTFCFLEGLRKSSAIIIAMLATSGPALADNQFIQNANLPTNIKPTCAANISTWFAGGNITANGWVAPANSTAPIFANFKDNTRCDFYKWGSQMFLWLTSGIGNNHVFNTAPVFYNVSVKNEVKGKTLRQFIAQDGPIYINTFKGKTDDEIEMGQAGNSDVLISQKESLVYYSLHANDVFALYTSGQKNGAFTKNKKLNTAFPSTIGELGVVADYAQKYGYPLGWEKIAMAMELKLSWVDATTVTNRDDYVLTTAIVPKYDRSNTQSWPVVGDQPKVLALVGMHVVGTVNGHPEMVWSTFEHVDNVPDNTYVYTSSSNKNIVRSYNSKTNDWQFLPQAATKPATITATGSVDSDSNNISASNKNPIGPSQVLRVDPWGNQNGKSPGSAAISNNTDLASINLSVLSQLKAGDVRGNYIQTGGIWTAEGQIPSSGTDSSLRGSLKLANTTMETYYQYHNKQGFNPGNCFGCHASSPDQGNGVSHIFDELLALPPK